MEPRWLLGASLMEERVESWGAHPFDLPVVQTLNLELDGPVSIFVGENGSGKSTVLRALAVLSGFPSTGGGKNESGARFGAQQEDVLSNAVRPRFRRRPRWGWYFRADLQAHFAAQLKARQDDPLFRGDAYGLYGGDQLHKLSHGEAFLAVLANQTAGGLYLLDEPESALSPERQLLMLAHLAHMMRAGNAQFVIATHSPIVMSIPGAQLLSFDGGEIRPVRVEDTSHYKITRRMLEKPESYWDELAKSD